MARTGPRKIASTTAPVIFENRVAAQVLSPLLGAVSGPAVARARSSLAHARARPPDSDRRHLAIRGSGAQSISAAKSANLERSPLRNVM